MSAVLTKTWNFLSHNISSLGTTGPRWTVPDPEAGSAAHLPAGLAQFLHALYLCETKDEERQLVAQHLVSVKEKLKEPNLKTSVMADALVRAMACSILGYDVTFAHIYALQLAEKGSLLEKKMGYLASTLWLNPSDELILLLINTVMKDLSSKNIVEINLALSVVVYLTPSEMSPMILPILNDKLSHSKEFIRKKSLICMQQMIIKNPNLGDQLEPKIYQSLSDPDPGVVAVAVQVSRTVAEIQVDPDLSLIPSLISILCQIQNNKLPTEYSRRGIPAPFFQVDILRMMSILVEKSQWDPDTYEMISKSVVQTLDSVSAKDTCGQAIISECIRVISVLNRFESDSARTSKALHFINRFLSSKHNNVKYVGLGNLEDLCRYCPPKLNDVEEENVLNCLSHCDESIKRKTLSLLVVLANQENVRKVCENILEFIRKSNDEYQRYDLIGKALELTKKFKVSLDWKVSFMLKLLQASSPGSQREEILEMLKKSVSVSNKDVDKVGRKMTALLKKIATSPNPPTVALRLYVWCLSKLFSTHDGEQIVLKPEEAIDTIISIGLQKKESFGSENWEQVLISCLDACFYLILQQNVECSQNLTEFVLKCESESNSNEVMDMANEIKLILGNLKKMREVFSTEPDFDVEDFTLTYLDKIVVDALKNDLNAIPYEPSKARVAKICSGTTDLSSGNLRFTSYQFLRDSDQFKEIHDDEDEDKSSSQSSERKARQLWSLQGREEQTDEANQKTLSEEINKNQKSKLEEATLSDLDLNDWKE